MTDLPNPNAQNPKKSSDPEPSPSQETELSWEKTGLDQSLLELIDAAGFVKPTAIQQQCIPIALKDQDLIASARTGSGKTASFVLPMVKKLAKRRGTFGLILCPTREIALQTYEVLQQFGKPMGMKFAALIGGVNMKSDSDALAHYPQVIVGTPGRICDHLDRGNLWLEYIEMVVLDEADRILDMGFSNQVNQIMDATPESRQTMLFSATMPSVVHRLAEKILKDPEKVAIGDPLATSHTVDQLLLWVNEDNKKREVMRLIQENSGTTIIFTHTKEGASKLWRWLHAGGIHDSTYISSSKKQEHREEALQGFKDGKYRILIATDVAGRGIHVEGVGLVINYDFPDEPEDYIHRIGRTGRKETKGSAISFVTPRDSINLIRLEKTIKRSIPEQRTADYYLDIRPRRKRTTPSKNTRKSKTRNPRKKRTSSQKPRSR